MILSEQAIAVPDIRPSANGFELIGDAATGLWTGLEYCGETLMEEWAGFYLSLGGGPIWERNVGRVKQTPNTLILLFDYIFPNYRRNQAIQTIKILRESVYRSVIVKGHHSQFLERLRSVTLIACGFLAGSASETLVSMPITRCNPPLPLGKVATRDAGFEKNEDGHALGTTGLDISLGGTAIARSEPLLQMAIILLPEECSVKVRLHGAGGQLSVEHEFVCESWLQNGFAVKPVTQIFRVIRESWQAAARGVAQCWESHGYPPPNNRPQWANEAVILEVDLTFHGGINKLCNSLNEFCRIGFNTLYLLPWHPGHWDGDGTYRYDGINPSYGLFNEFRKLCDTAHEKGMRVHFNPLVNVAGGDSPYPMDHPDWFSRDKKGNNLRHSTWEMRRRHENDEERDVFKRLFDVKASLGAIASHELFFLENVNQDLLSVKSPSHLGKIRTTSIFSSIGKSEEPQGQLCFSLYGGSNEYLAPYDTTIVIL